MKLDCKGTDQSDGRMSFSDKMSLFGAESSVIGS